MFFPALVLRALVFCSSSYAATKQFSIELEWATASPDGFEKQQIFVNGQSPGPALVIDQDDDVEFLVTNQLDVETAIHFHGIEQLNTPWSDGVPGLSQKPIEAGCQWLYKWKATEYGTYWYHAHYQSQIFDGLFGPIHIKPRLSEPKPFSAITGERDALEAIIKAEDDPHFVMISDRMRLTSQQYRKVQEDSNVDIYCTNSILFNGKGRVNCLSEAEQRAALAPPFQDLFNGPLRGQWLSPNGCFPFGTFSQGNATLNLDAIPKDLVTGCSATNTPLQEFQVDPRLQWTSLNFISAAGIQAPVISIDEHPMWVYAVDGRYIEPVKVNGLQIYNGERYSVMVQLDRRQGTYTMRANNFALNQLISGFATVSYSRRSDDVGNNCDNTDDGSEGEGWSGGHWQGRHGYGRGRYDGKAGAWKSGRGRDRKSGIGKYNGRWKRDSQPYYTFGGFPVSPDGVTLNQSQIVPFHNIPPAQEVAQTHVLRVSRFGQPWVWSLDGDNTYPMFPTEYAEDAPLLYYPESTEASNRNLVIKTQNDTWVDIVFVVVDLNGPPHPMQKHSNKGYLLGRGAGPWNWSSVAEAAAAQPQSFNFDNPQYRDGFTTLPSAGAPTWLAMRYHVVNPGAFMLHCHIQSHLSGGMALALLDGVNAFPAIPAEYGVKGEGNGLGGIGQPERHHRADYQ